jgi:threonine/homoserine/homoserine lactone efflux protein
MSFDIWFLFFLSYLVVTLSPGPNVLFFGIYFVNC